MAIDGTSLLFLLLPVAAASGWWAARQRYRNRDREEPPSRLSSHYLKGMNYLINEQPDKALEVFIYLAEVDNETIDTHLALGALFRRRGEVDRAIRIHQNIIARPTLSQAHRNTALFELAQDYLRAGVLDRAETLFAELQDQPVYSADALRALVQIYEQEKDWLQAIDAARRLERVSGQPMQAVIAQYYSELAELAMDEGSYRQAGDYLRRALIAHRGCVRASMLQGDLARENGDYSVAARAYRRVLDQDMRYFSEVMDAARESFGRSGDFRGERAFLREIALRLQRNGDTGPSERGKLMELTDPAEISRHFQQYVQDRPDVDGIYEFLVAMDDHSSVMPGGERATLEAVRRGLGHVLARTDHYRCQNCGFAGKQLHWQCPSCRTWGSVLPTRDRMAAAASSCRSALGNE